MAKIFLNYRREETSGHAGRLYDRLSQHFGPDNIFMDLDTLKPGVDFAQDIDQAVGQCEVMVSLVGKSWLVLPDEIGAPRIKNPEDWVRLEIQAALERNIPVVPVLVQRASMPSQNQVPSDIAQFTRRQAFELLDNRFHQDADNLIKRLEEILQAVGKSQTSKKQDEGPLQIIYDESKHFKMEKENNQCALCRVAVHNPTDVTIENIVLKIIYIVSDVASLNNDLKNFKNLNLAISDSTQCENDAPPESFCEFLHPHSQCTFDIVRIVPDPGNHQIKHARYVKNKLGRDSQFVRYQQHPRGVIPPGRYKLKFAAQGKNIQRTEKFFEFWGIRDGVKFRPIEENSLEPIKI